MSNQSGISVSSGLASSFPDFAQSSDIAAILRIDHENECVALFKRIKGSLEDVRDALAPGKEAYYVALRIPSGMAFVQFMPDLAPLSSKMKYASSHATIHRQLGGSSLFTTNIFWTELEEVSIKGLDAHSRHVEAPPPMTDEESSLASALLSQGTRGHSVAGQSTLAIHVNVSEQAQTSLKKLGKDSALVFMVDAANSESIELVSNTSINDLASSFHALENPRYVVANLNEKVIFAFVCPRQASIKQRMLFASTRISFGEYLKTLLSVDAQIETFEPEKDLQIESLQAELKIDEPTPVNQRPKFSRPRPPKRK